MNIPMQSKMRIESRRSQRDGMALLFVVSLILFITLLGASFVIVSTQFATSAKTHARLDARGDSSRSYVFRAFYDLLRGPSEPMTTNSPLNTQDLLVDMYGYGVKSPVGGAGATVTANAIPGVFDVTFVAVSVIDGAAFAFSPINDIYNGQILTFVSGGGRGISCRVIDYDGVSNTFAVLPEQSNGNLLVASDLDGGRVVLNGCPFSGFGAGGVAAGGNLGISALVPRRMNDPSYFSTAPNGSLGVVPTFGPFAGYASTGVNESYDAYDYQNMFLGMIDGANIRASFNQPNLFAYHVTNTPALRDDEKYANFRPPTGFYADQVIAAGDPNAVLVNSGNGWANPTEALDVDNDGDGVNDSIWIDPGYPIQTDIDGRRFKTLVAYLVLDMDSRLNVNANGSLFDINRFLDFTSLPSPPLLGDVNADNLALPNGQHLGPPEVSLEYLFNDATVYANVMQSRYGLDVLPGIGIRSDIPGNHLRDPWIVYEDFGYPDMFHPYGTETYPNAYVGGLFGTTLDIHGRYTTGIPQYGLIADPPIDGPLSVISTSGFANLSQENASSAYEFSLLPQSRYPFTTPPVPQISDDQPFTAKEVERFLRQYDRDSKMLPSRLWDLTATVATPDTRNFLTASSWEVPALPSMEHVTGLPITPVQAVYELLVASAHPNPNAEMEKLLAPEVRMGLPMDLNRPFGNGRDDNTNGVYDEQWQTTNSAGIPIPSAPAFDESAAGEVIRNVQNTFNISLDTDADGLAANSHLARQEFARHLFALALLATGDTADIVPDFINHPLAGNTARRVTLAQWAINIVDIRDSDSIHTPFEFDINPFNGWNADGWLGINPNTGNDDSDPLSPSYSPERYVVWGAERPELLISETLMTHDRRSENLDADPDFENRLTPRATAFIELHHPWNQNDSNQLLPAELRDGLNGINLNASVAATDDPVWRLLVVRGAAATTADLNPDREPIIEDDIARKIYFVRPDTSIDPDERPGLGSGKTYSGQKVYYAGTATNGLITRGGYAVIGSSGVGTDPVATDGVTFFGRRTTAGWIAELNQTRRIDLDPLTRTLYSYQTEDGIALERYDVAKVLIDQPRSLGLSDPDGGYGPGQIEIEDGFQLAAPTTSPIDSTDPHYSAFTMTDGVYETFSQLYLQRLANPLAPFDRVANPYVTVDSKPLDLIAFNGVEDDSTDPTVIPADMVFAAAERGRVGDSLYGFSQPAQNRRWLWSSAEGGINLATAAMQPHFVDRLGADSHHHSFNLYDTLGELNGSYSDVSTVRFPRTTTDLNSGANPPMPFTGFTWNNRPFAGHMDLLDVPFTDSFEMLIQYRPYDTFGATDLYNSAMNVREFGHLFNFFREPNFGVFPEIPGRLSAVLDYVRVPSRFAGTRQHLNSSLPPFNVLSRYREPGKSNLNTLSNVDIGSPSSSPVWRGLLGPFGGFGLFPVTDIPGLLMDGSPAPSYGFNDVETGAAGFEGSRRGPEQPALGAGPALFDKPFRTANEFAKLPIGIYLPADPVQATMLRNEAPTPTPVFDYPIAIAVNRELPFANPLRDAASRHEVFRRLANTTTTRSSVFSIWITVGKFEVDEQGRLLGPNLVEIGADNGKAERSRGFFMIDRSIPVAYEPGKNHNIENMILVESIIE